jgi:hypothetical protein
MPTAKSLRAFATKIREQARLRLQEAEEHMHYCERAADELERAANAQDETRAGRGAAISMPAISHALKISAGKAVDPLNKACVHRGMTMGQMTKQVGEQLGRRVPDSGISQARRGVRPIRRDVAAAIDALVGFPATKANWPGGIRDV